MADDQDIHAPEGDETEKHDDFGIDQKRMPFTAHLVELRARILICIIAIGVLFFAIFFVFGQYLFQIMELPVRRAAESTGGNVDYKDLLISLTPAATFVTVAIVSLLASVSLGMPLILYEIWAFVAPGLKKRERKFVVPVLLIGSFFFIAGALFCYFVILNIVLGYLLSYTLAYGVKPTWNIGDVIKFESVMILVFGLAFELPLVLVGLVRIGAVTPEMVAKKRRHAIVLIFIVAAILTPPDVFSQVALAIPLCILLEIGIQASKFFRPKGSLWDRWDRWQQPEPPPPTSPGPSAPPQPPAEPAAGGYSEDEYHGDQSPYAPYGTGQQDEEYGGSHEDQSGAGAEPPPEDQGDQPGEAEEEPGHEGGGDDGLPPGVEPMK